MLKKILKIVGILFLLIFIALFTIPFFFKDQIQNKITSLINEKVNAKVSFSSVDLSLIKNFPNASVTLNNFLIINKAPFEGDTLVSVNELNLKMAVTELLNKDGEPIKIQGFTTKNGFVNVIMNKDGVGNFDIAIKDNSPQTTQKSKPLALKIQEYKIENYKIQYFDQKSQLKMVLDSLNHEGKGDFTNSILDLTTKTSTKVTVNLEKVNFIKKMAFQLDAVLGIDLEKNKYVFKDNKALFNQLPLVFDGSLQMQEKGQDYDLKFKTLTSSFKNFLALIPEVYATSLEGVKTAGNFTVNGFAKGTLTDATIPKFNVEIISNDGSFQYPNLSKTVQNIILDTRVINETGLIKDTYVNLDKLSFKIDQDVFNAKANIKNLNTNPLINAVLKGTINLSNLSKAYPIKLSKPLTGIMKADVTTQFDMQSVEKSQYQNIKNAGTISLSGFNYQDSGKTLSISNALVQFDPNRVNLKQFEAKTGKSDISLTGTLNNFYGFIFKNQELQGNFIMNSNQLAVNDFMTTATAPAVANSETNNTTPKNNTKSSDAMKIPAFLNCTLTAKANTVLYDNLILKDVSGKLLIKDQKATLENLKTSVFGGTIGVNGSVATKEKIPVYNMNLAFNQIDIKQSFTQLEMLKKIAPLAGIVTGKMNTNIKLNGNLNPKEMTPDVKSLSGDLTGQLFSTGIDVQNSVLLSALASNLKFLDPNKLNLNDAKITLAFKDGRVNVKPFNVKYQDIKAVVQGTHGFDQTIDYNIKFDLPAKYLAKELGSLSSKINPADIEKLKDIPVNVLLTGSFDKPKVGTDMKVAVNNIATQLAAQQKNKLLDKGASELDKLLNKGKKDTDTTKVKTTQPQTEAIKSAASSLLNGLFKKKN